MDSNPIEDKNEAQHQVQPITVDFLPKWLRFCAYNHFIEGINIIPFKCPLMKKYNEYLKKEEFSPFKDVYDYSVKMNKPITDVIDLTYTDRYYDPKVDEFFPAGVQHHKFRLSCKKIPKPEVVDAIMNVMDEVIKEGGAIGVHCTHGVNRTGYIVCTFMVLKLGWEPEKAIAAFKLARSHGIEYSIYIEAVLALRSNSGEEKGNIDGNVAGKGE